MGHRTRSRSSCSFLATLTFVALLTAASVAAQDERVSVDDGLRHVLPSVARLSNDQIVYAWIGAPGLFGGEGTVFARRYDSTGNALDAAPFQVNTEAGAHDFVTVEADGTGGFVVVWHRYEPNDDTVEGVRARIYDADGLPEGDQFVVQTQTNASQVRPSLAVHDDGSFVVAWEANLFDGDISGIAARRFDSMGNGLGPEFVVNEVTLGRQDTPEVAMSADGDFVVIWGNGSLTARLFDSSGTPQTGDIQILTGDGFDRFRNGLAMADDGHFMVAYEAGPIRGHIFDSTGTDITGEITVSTDMTHFKSFPAIAADAAGNFQVVWESTGQDGGGDGIYTKKVSPTGLPIGVETRVNGMTASNQRRADVTMSSDGTPTFVWQGAFDDGTATFTNCESLGPCAVFIDGFESGDTTLWSTASP